MSNAIHHKSVLRTVPLILCLALVLLVSGPLQGQDKALKALGFTRSLVIEIKNPGSVDLVDHPITLKVNDLRAKAPDFNSYNFGLFEVVGGEYRLVQTQADDLDKDRYHDEIFFLKTIPARGVVKLLCFYSPKGSMRLFITPKVFIRSGVKEHKNEVSWESLPVAWKFDVGRIIPYGKFTRALVLQQLRSEDSRPQGWGMRLIDPDATAGAGGLSVWDGAARRPLYSDDPSADIFETPVIVSMGPLRTLVRIDYKPVQTAAGSVSLSCLYSQPADVSWMQVEVSVRGTSKGQLVLGPTIRKASGETSGLDKARGFFYAWGKGSTGSGESGAAVIFKPASLSGLDDMGKERGVKFNLAPGTGLTYWLASAWSRGANSPAAPAAGNWRTTVAGLADGLTLPIEISITPGK